MRKTVKGFISGFLVCLLICSTVLAVAASGDVSISALLMSSIQMKLYGKDFAPKEADGSYTLPISYNGRTYLPVRALAEALNVPVEWDGDTRIIWIGGKMEEVPVNDVSQYENYYGTVITKDSALLSTAKQSYKWGIVNEKPLELAYYGCYLKPEGKYKKFTASVFLDEGVKKDLILELRKDTYDGEVIKSYTLKPGETLDIEADIAGIDKFYIIADVKIGHDKVTKLVIGEPTFKNEPVKVETETDIK